MAKNVRIEWNDAGFVEILQSEGVRELVLSQAERIATAATANIPEPSEGYTANAVKKPTRWVAGAATTDEASVRAESEYKALSRAV